MKAIRALVRGRVQGVGFRDYVETRARRLRLRGFVRNLADGSVEVVAEGDEAALRELLNQLGEGPEMARVDGVEVEWLEATGRYGEFGTAW